jgi:hypothetical protein
MIMSKDPARVNRFSKVFVESQEGAGLQPASHEPRVETCELGRVAMRANGRTRRFFCPTRISSYGQSSTRAITRLVGRCALLLGLHDPLRDLLLDAQARWRHSCP